MPKEKFNIRKGKVFYSSRASIKVNGQTYALNSINASLGDGKPNICDVCKRQRAAFQLNYNARIHHDERLLKCIDRKSCERAKRKLK